MKSISMGAATALGLGGTLTGRGWQPPDDMSKPDWLRAGEALAEVESGVSWWIGDWWRFGERSFRGGKEFLGSSD